MAFIDFDIDSFDDFEEYPYHGKFLKYVVDQTKPLDEQVEEEVLIFETKCDIQKRSGLRQSNLLAADYTIYFPLELNPESTGTIDKYKDCGVRRCHIFKGEFYGNLIEGVVEMVRPSQLGSMSVDIKVVTEHGVESPANAD